MHLFATSVPIIVMVEKFWYLRTRRSNFGVGVKVMILKGELARIDSMHLLNDRPWHLRVETTTVTWPRLKAEQGEGMIG